MMARDSIIGLMGRGLGSDLECHGDEPIRFGQSTNGQVAIAHGDANRARLGEELGP